MSSPVLVEQLDCAIQVLLDDPDAAISNVDSSVAELLSVANQTDVLVENASAEVLRDLAATAERGGARVVETRAAQRSLERVFLDSTKQS